ncbi:hypothetical protein E2C01_064726 [Portunus trituberculatus]|uniref:Uncharacterized protein n=1 Tax=Portunus trituberculatus TaxID=210409 RepID=A0A5B7HMM8_PORTR|nr:hypothetical protein [Portunus trituberculatus]
MAGLETVPGQVERTYTNSSGIPIRTSAQLIFFPQKNSPD